jgi:hypothetical protein
MTGNNIQFENGEFGLKAVLTSAWSSTVMEELVKRKPFELELNTSKGWSGKDIEFLHNLPWLKSIVIIDLLINNITPINSLAELINIKVITYCKSVIDFSAFPLLQNCALEWRPKVSSLFDCKNLKNLFLNRYSGKSFEPFKALSNLESLAILNSPLSDLEGIGRLPRLQSLRLANLRQLDSLSGLEDARYLNELEIVRCRSINSITEIACLHNLRKLNISDNDEIESLSPLAKIKNLNELLFYESTNILDGDLAPILLHKSIVNVSFQNRKHYSHKREYFTKIIRSN